MTKEKDKTLKPNLEVLQWPLQDQLILSYPQNHKTTL